MLPSNAGRYHRTTLKSPSSRPLVAELVDPSPRQLTRAGVATLLLAATPVAARLGWWWWSQSRQRNLTVGPASDRPSFAVERLEIEMVRRTLGRSRLRVTSTRWQGEAAEPGPANTPSRRQAWLGPTLRLARAALEVNSRKSATSVPRLPAPPLR